MKNLFFAIALLIFFACKDNERPLYEGCCGAKPINDSRMVSVLDTAGGHWSSRTYSGRVYIPNIFMPNSNNSFPDNFFTAYGGSGTSEILSAIFTGDNGEIFFSRDSLPISIPLAGWSGLKPDGTYHYGPFNYEVKIKYLDGQTKTFTGKACAFHCGDTDFPKEQLPRCFFLGQNKGTGQGFNSLPFNESCFN